MPLLAQWIANPLQGAQAHPCLLGIGVDRYLLCWIRGLIERERDAIFLGGEWPRLLAARRQRPCCDVGGREVSHLGRCTGGNERPSPWL